GVPKHAPPPWRLLEHVLAGALVEFDDLLDRLAERKPGSDDRACAGPAEIIEEVAEPECIALARQGAQLILHPLQELQRDHAHDAAAVEGKHALLTRTLRLIEHLVPRCSATNPAPAS